MRLTLRTLLAYLDDTLDPAQARQIGEKVAESAVAQELVEKIKRVSRKRSLTIPSATGPDTADPNVVAEYLDNDLPGDKIAEIEEQALHSDVHLAEIAACHQLLTLIMSEPAKVPPMARQRMYNLVKGPEVDQNRVVPRVAPATLAELELPDDTDGSVLVSRRGGVARAWIAGALALGLPIVVWQATRHPSPSAPPAPIPPVAIEKKDQPTVADAPKEKEHDKTTDVVKDGMPEKEKEKEKDVGKGTDMVKDARKDQGKETKQPTEKEKMPNDKPPANAPPPPPPAAKPDLSAERKPSDDRKEVGKLNNAGVLLQRAQDNGEWKRVPANGPIAGGTRLLALPGTTSEVRLSDVVIELFGTMSEIHQLPLFESSAAAFAPGEGFSADVRLDRGRVYLKSSKPTGAKLRLRLGNDLFDITLPDDKSEVMAERTSLPDGVPYSRDLSKQQAPIAQGSVTATQGQATVRLNLGAEGKLVAGPKPSMWRWTSTGAADKLEELAEPNPLWSRVPNINGPERAVAVEMEQAIKRLPRQLGDSTKPINLAISELLIDRAKPTKRVGIFAQAALDDLAVLDVLDDPTNPDQRQAAMFAVHNWLGRSADRAKLLFDALVKQKRFTDFDAEAALTLWFGYSDADLKDPRAYASALDALNSDKLPVRELALWRMSTQLDQEGAKTIRYVPTDPADVRQRAVQEWKRRIPDGQLPPGKMR